MRLQQILLSFFILSLLMWAGCSNAGMSPTSPSTPNEERKIDYLPEEFCGDATTVDLIAGLNTDVGSVIVTNDEDYLYVHFEVEAPWVIVDTHVAVSNIFEEIPQTKKGNPKVGNFRYDMDSMIPLNWECGTELYVAAHAVVQKLGPNGEILESQTGWGEGEDFPGDSWAMYFMHTVQCCYKDVNVTLPDYPVNAVFYHPGPSSYWRTNLSGIVGDYNVWDGDWLGWCVDLGHYIQPGQPYTVLMYSSYDPALPAYAQDPDWDMVNWVINHKHPDATIDDIQATIWYFIGGGGMPGDPESVAMIDDAIANGEGYRPGLGDWFAVVLDPVENTSGDRSQLTIIEVDP